MSRGDVSNESEQVSKTALNVPEPAPLAAVSKPLLDQFVEFDTSNFGKALTALRSSPDSEADVGMALAELEALTSTAGDLADLFDIINEWSERHICLGAKDAAEHDYVRVTSLLSLLCYYSKKLIYVERKERRTRMEKEVKKIKAIYRYLERDDLDFFLNTVLNLNGHLRQIGHPLWLSPADDVAMCGTSAAYINRLALGYGDSETLIQFNIGWKHREQTTNFRPDDPRYDVGDKMTVHIPTELDGMYYPAFVKGGRTAGGAREYVSRLDNTDAIDWIRIV